MRAEDIWAKSIVGNLRSVESLSAHTQRVLSTFDQWRHRLAFLPDICQSPRFWDRAGLCVLLHDLGKCAVGFQRMVKDGVRFQHRHEVLSTSLLPWIVPSDSDEFGWISAGILAHHKDLARISQLYPAPDSVLDITDGLGQLLPEIENGFFDRAAEYYTRFLRPQAQARFAAPPLVQAVSSPAEMIGNIRKSIDAYSLLVGQLQMLSSDHPKNLEALFIRGVVNLCDHAGSAHVKLDGNSFPSVENLLQLFSFQADALFQHQNHACQIHNNAALIA